jgi:hypothetical protein
MPIPTPAHPAAAAAAPPAAVPPRRPPRRCRPQPAASAARAHSRWRRRHPAPSRPRRPRHLHVGRAALACHARATAKATRPTPTDHAMRCSAPAALDARRAAGPTPASGPHESTGFVVRARCAASAPSTGPGDSRASSAASSAAATGASAAAVRAGSPARAIQPAPQPSAPRHSASTPAGKGRGRRCTGALAGARGQPLASTRRAGQPPATGTLPKGVRAVPILLSWAASPSPLQGQAKPTRHTAQRGGRRADARRRLATASGQPPQRRQQLLKRARIAAVGLRANTGGAGGTGAR